MTMKEKQEQFLKGFRYRLTNCLHKELYKAIKSETLCAKTV